MQSSVPVRAGPVSIVTTTRSLLVTGQHPLDPTTVPSVGSWANALAATPSNNPIINSTRMIDLAYR